MIPAEKVRVQEAFETIGNLENYMITWDRDCELLLKICDDKLKDKALPQPERDHIAQKVVPAIKTFRGHVVAAKTAAAAAIEHCSDANLDKYADAHTFGQAVGAATQVLLAAAGAGVAPLVAALPFAGKPGLSSEARMKELLNTHKAFLQNFPHFTSAISKLSAPPVAPARVPKPLPIPPARAVAAPAPARPGSAAPTSPPRPSSPAPNRP